MIVQKTLITEVLWLLWFTIFLSSKLLYSKLRGQSANIPEVGCALGIELYERVTRRDELLTRLKLLLPRMVDRQGVQKLANRLDSERYPIHVGDGGPSY